MDEARQFPHFHEILRIKITTYIACSILPLNAHSHSHMSPISSLHRQEPVTAAPQCALCAWTYANGPRSFSSVRGQLVPLLNLLFRFLDRNVRALLESTAVILVDLLSIQKHLILIMKNSMR